MKDENEYFDQRGQRRIDTDWPEAEIRDETAKLNRYSNRGQRRIDTD